RHGSPRAGDHLVVVESGACATTLMCRRAFTPPELEELRRFTSERGWSFLFDPGRAGGDPTLRALLVAPTDEREAALEKLPTDLRPPADDRPFFFHAYRWRALWRGVPPPTGDALLIFGVCQMALLSVLFVALPLVGRRHVLSEQPGSAQALGAFALLGAGFMA